MVGNMLNVLSLTNVSRRCEVRAQSGDKILVHYVNFADKYDEWLPVASDRIVPDAKSLRMNFLADQQGRQQPVPHVLEKYDDPSRSMPWIFHQAIWDQGAAFLHMPLLM